MLTRILVGVVVAFPLVCLLMGFGVTVVTLELLRMEDEA